MCEGESPDVTWNMANHGMSSTLRGGRGWLAGFVAWDCIINSCGVFPGLGGAASTRGSSAAKSRTRQFRVCVHHKFMFVWSVNGLALSRKYSIPVGNTVGWENLQFLPGLHTWKPEPEPEVRFNWGQVKKIYLRFAWESFAAWTFSSGMCYEGAYHLLSIRGNLSFLVNDVNGRQP